MRRPAATPSRPSAPQPRAGGTSIALRPIVLLVLLALLPSIACRPGGDREAEPATPAGSEGAAAPASPPGTTPPGTTAPAPGPAGDERQAQDPEAWRHSQPAADLPADRPLRAAFLVVDGVYDSELMAPYDVLHHTVFHTAPRPGIEVFTVSPDGQPVTTYEGLRISPHHSFASAPAIDILVVPSAKGSMDADLQNAALIDWVRRTGAQARYVMSLCDGAFVLAKAGLLEGKAATTFPDDYDRFSRMFPGVDLRINLSFVHDGKFLTSQGGAKSYAVAMHLVDSLYGEKVAQGVGHGLLIPWPSPPAAEPHVVEGAAAAPAGAPAAPGGAGTPASPAGTGTPDSPADTETPGSTGAPQGTQPPA